MKKATRPKSVKTSDNVILKPATNLLQRQKGDGSVVIMLPDCFDHFITIDGVSAQIWSLIDGKLTIAQIKERIMSIYDPPKTVFQRDFERVIKRLHSLRLLRK